MPRQSAGLLLYRRVDGKLEVFLVHPGGPYWANKDAGAWSLPKGELEADEDPLATARRELTEETGLVVDGPFRALGQIRQAGGKIVHAWAAEADCDAAQITSNSFSVEWPPRSGQWREFPEVDRAAWMAPALAAEKINPAQAPLISRLVAALGPRAE